MTERRGPDFAGWLERELRGPRMSSQQAAERELLDRLFAFAMAFVLWWHEAGRVFYGKGAGDAWVDRLGGAHQRDDGLILLANDAVRVLGGWRRARAVIRADEQRDAAARLAHATKSGRGIRLREE